MRPCLVLAAATTALLCATACGKSTRDGGSSTMNVPSGGTAPIEEPPIVEEACNAAPKPGPSPLRRLSRFQLENTFRDLFQDAPAVLDAVQLELDGLPPSYIGENLAPPTAVTVEHYHDIAHVAAKAVSDDPMAVARLTGCGAPDADDLPCATQFAEHWLELSYRRPASDDELIVTLDVFLAGQELGGDFASGVRAVIEVTLQEPDFLYLVEQGDGDDQDGVVALSAHETAARLAYFLTGSMPDAELRAAAQAGVLGEADIEAHARRLLGGPGSRLVTRHFFEQLLRLQNVSSPSGREPPIYTAEIAQASLEETRLFVEHVTFDGAGTFAALFTEPYSFMNGKLAAFYGEAGPSGDAFEQVELNPMQRSGVLTQSAFLTATSPGGATRPVLRGIAVLTKVLCVELPPPPPDIAIPLPAEIPPNATRRQQLEIATQDPSCQSCHRDIDPIGFAFEHYNPVGQWRVQENNLLIDSSGTLYKTDAQGPFADAVELLQRIAQSPDAQHCFARNWLEYGHDRPVAPEDTCALEQLDQAMQESGGNVVELLVALTKTDQFRYRQASELQR